MNIHRTLFKIMYVSLQGAAIIAGVCVFSIQHWIGGAALAAVALCYELLSNQTDRRVKEALNGARNERAAGGAL